MRPNEATKVTVPWDHLPRALDRRRCIGRRYFLHGKQAGKVETSLQEAGSHRILLRYHRRTCRVQDCKSKREVCQKVGSNETPRPSFRPRRAQSTHARKRRRMVLQFALDLGTWKLSNFLGCASAELRALMKEVGGYGSAVV